MDLSFNHDSYQKSLTSVTVIQKMKYTYNCCGEYAAKRPSLQDELCTKYWVYSLYTSPIIQDH